MKKTSKRRSSRRLRSNTAETGVLVTIPLPTHLQTPRKYANITSYPTVAKALAVIRSKLRKDTLDKIESVDAYVYPDAATSEYPSGYLRFQRYKEAGTYLWRMWGGPRRYEGVFSVFDDDEKLRPNASLKWYSPDVNIWVTHPVDILSKRVGGGVVSNEVIFRADGRDGQRYRVDRSNALMGLWEAIDGGRAAAPETLTAAKKLASAWLRAAQDQGTLSPRGV